MQKFQSRILKRFNFLSTATIVIFAIASLYFFFLTVLACTPERKTEVSGTYSSVSARSAEERELPPLSLSFVGDIMAHDVNINRPPYGNIYKRVSPLLTEDDLSFGNLEFPVVADMPVSNYPVFNVHPPYVEAAIEAGFDVFSVANNHITDKGTHGVIKTYEALRTFEKERGISFSGITGKAEPVEFNPNKPEPTGFTPCEIEVKGWRVGFIAATEFLNSDRGAEYVNLVSFSDSEGKDRFIQDIARWSPEYDLFIVSFHCGNEYSRIPDGEKLLFFHALLEAGAHIVWSHHPHVLQPWYTCRYEERKKCILSSSGNFISGQTWWLDPEQPDMRRIHTGESAIFRIRVEKRGGKTTVLDISPYIIFNYKHPEYGMIVSSFEQLINDDTLSEEFRGFYQSRLQDIKCITADNGIHNVMRE